MADPPVSKLQPALRHAVHAADEWRAHALADLMLCETERPSDELRATAWASWRATLLSAALRLAQPLGWQVHADAALATLDEAGWTTPDRMAPAWSAARHRLLGARLLDAARPFGVTDPLDELSTRTGRTGALARDLRNTREDESVVLEAEGWHDLCWTVAAALRVVADPTGDEDAALRASVAAALSAHDEAGGTEAVARRLARRLSPDRLMPGEALLAGHTHLAAALLAERVAVPVEQLSEWLLAPDPTPLAVALRAGGEDAAGVGGLVAALTGARGGPIAPLTERIAALHELSVEAAGELLRESTR